MGSRAERVSKLFEQADAYAKAHNTKAIIFLDEVDAIAGKRGRGDSGASHEYDRVVNAILERLDGIRTYDNLIVIAATNFPDNLDPAFKQRMYKQVYLEVPDMAQLEQIFAPAPAQAREHRARYGAARADSPRQGLHWARCGERAGCGG